MRQQGELVNKESSLERHYYIRSEQADLLYANANDLIQSGGI